MVGFKLDSKLDSNAFWMQNQTPFSKYGCQDMADITTPLKQFTDAVLAQEAAARKKEMVGVASKI